MAFNIPSFLNSPPVPDAPFWEKIKSKKFIFVGIWSVFIVWGFILQFLAAGESGATWFKEVLKYGFWINSVAILSIGIEDLPKADSSWTLTSRKTLITLLQVVFLVVGFVLSYYVSRVAPTAPGLTYLNELIQNAGSAIVALIGVGFTVQNGKLVSGTAPSPETPAPADSATKEK